MTAATKRAQETRTERDALGERRIAAQAPWGIHTERARDNFRLTGRPVRRAFILALLDVKRACAEANRELGHLEDRVGEAIVSACEDLIADFTHEAFPVDALQGGAGTSLNMNVNEVVANRALARLGRASGDYGTVHPLDHVNLHQSTNDTVPTALRVAAIRGLRELSAAFAELQGAFQRKEQAFANIVALGRTERVAAVPLTLGAEFSAFAGAFARDRWRTFKCEERLRVVNLGGTAVGTGLTAPRDYIFLAIEKLRTATGVGLSRGENMVDQTANADAFVEVSGVLDAAASNLIKIADDLRTLSMLGEIRLPAVQPGSSIMPGKVNPVILESVIQAAIRVRAHHGTVADGASRASLQICEFLPLLGDALLESIELLANAAQSLAVHADGIEADAARCREHLDRSPELITAFVPELGYDRCAGLVKDWKCTDHGDMRAFLKEKLGDDAVRERLSPQALTALGHQEARKKY
ncbi:lyase family protein [Kiritimatiella glycovorans]|uniref:Aspartate ammonia-lyase n=1 Tax=Kiritimatiella glycovorans TaxID=1307763 RepID=A0A0G3EF57_9BACT|nr:lyase family protein [Kiritimatiella glycovorans]AKJ65091.1 Aspartate ammonia-lyase [Kiritimatiella glycovorans]